MRRSWLYLAVRSPRARGAGLDLAEVQRDGQIGDERVFGLARAVRHDAGVAGAKRHLHAVERLGQRADLVDLDEHAVRDAVLDAVRQDRAVGHEHVVADELDLAAEALRDRRSSRPCRLRPSGLRSRRSDTPCTTSRRCRSARRRIFSASSRPRGCRSPSGRTPTRRRPAPARRPSPACTPPS